MEEGAWSITFDGMQREESNAHAQILIKATDSTALDH